MSSMSFSKYPFIDLSEYSTTNIEIFHDQLSSFSSPIFTIITTVKLSDQQQIQEQQSEDLNKKNHPIFGKNGITISRKMKDFEIFHTKLENECFGCLIPPKELITTNIDKIYLQNTKNISNNTNLESDNNNTEIDEKSIKGKYLSMYLLLISRHPTLSSSLLFWDFVTATEDEWNQQINLNTINGNVNSVDSNNNNGNQTNMESNKNIKKGILYNFKKLKFKNEKNYEKEISYLNLLLKNLKNILNNSMTLKKENELVLNDLQNIGKEMINFSKFEESLQNKELTEEFSKTGNLLQKLSLQNSQQFEQVKFQQNLFLYTKYLLPNILKFIQLNIEYHNLLQINENSTNLEILENLKKKVILLDERFQYEWERFKFELTIDLQYSILGLLIKQNDDNLEMLNILGNTNNNNTINGSDNTLQYTKRQSIVFLTHCTPINK
ncbi:hypothetical protein ABK040_006172 [Willaertia magna]